MNDEFGASSANRLARPASTPADGRMVSKPPPHPLHGPISLPCCLRLMLRPPPPLVAGSRDWVFLQVIGRTAWQKLHMS